MSSFEIYFYAFLTFIIITLLGLLVCYIDSKLPKDLKDKISDFCDTTSKIIGIIFLYFFLSALTGGAGFFLFPMWFLFCRE